MLWTQIIDTEQQKEYYYSLAAFLREEYSKYKCFPPKNDIFNAFYETPYDNTKVVILGQDPYHEKGQAMGLSFSVPDNIQIPPSLVNIYKEIESEYHVKLYRNGDLTDWAKQGVLLLNSVLSVREHQAGSHANHGWETFTDAILSSLNEKETPVVFMLWGKYAQNKSYLITNPIHLVLTSSHPSPLSASRGFLGNNHFKLCNNYLKNNLEEPINWIGEAYDEIG